jgi:putative transposase
MIMVDRAYRTEMGPTTAQKEFFGRCAGAQRVTYNWALGQCQEERAAKEPFVRTALDAIAQVDGFDELFQEVWTVKDLPSGANEKNDSDETKAQKKQHRRVASKCSAFLKRPECKPHKDILARDTLLISDGAVDVILTAGRIKFYDDDVAKWKAAGKPKGKKPWRPYLRIKDPDFNTLKKQWRALYRKDDKYEWMRVAPSAVIDSAFDHLFHARQRFFKYLRNGGPIEVGPPRFHSRQANESFTVISQPNGINVARSRIKLPNIGWVRLKERGYLPIGKTTQYVTVSSEGGRWFVSVLGEFDPETLPAGRPRVGIDVGIVHYAILQPQGGPVERVDNPKYFEQGERRLAMLQRRISRKQGPSMRCVTMPDGTERIVPERHPYVFQAREDGRKAKRHRQKPSKRWERLKRKVNKQHYRIACRRKHFLHELTTGLVRRFGAISVEILGIQDMIRRHGKKWTSRWLRQRIGDASWYEFRRQLMYKGLWYGTDVECVSRWYASTQECSKCRARTEVNWHDRKCRCSKCGLVIDMDDNAAENLLQEMLRPLIDKHKSSAAD